MSNTSPDESPVAVDQDHERGVESEEVYSLELVEKITLVPRRTILLYFRHGLIRTARRPGRDHPIFDSDSVRTLRRIEDLRRQFGVNLAGIKLIMGLVREVDELRAELRFRRQ
ncbi:MAG: MerR family transcriptional regulator [Verrucomicrobia bacterium]|nr:MerR family transcriptional regulator [Verrucomicrobiota bacterium]